MLNEKDHITSSETCTQNGDNIKSIDNNDGDARYPVELKDSVGTFDPEALAFDPNSEEIKKVRWKIDKRLIPLLAAMYLCSFLDRANIGNAKVAGMETDLNLQPGEFNIALSIFYVGYVIGEVPSNMALKQFGPRLWIPAVMFLWGTVMIAMAAVKTAGALYTARFFLGLAESGYAPGPVYVISMWYARNEQAIRVGLFFSASTVAGAFGGLLAYGMKERDLTIKRLAVEAGPGDESHFSWVQFWAAFKDWKVHMHMLIAFLHGIPFASLGLFIPSIVQGFGYDHITTQIMTVPIYVVACFSVISFTYSSDRKKERGFHLAILSFMATIGYSLLVFTRHSPVGVRYASLMICASGTYGYVPVMLSWSGVNIGGHTKRGVAIALIISIGQVGSVIGGQLYRNDDAPLYVRGHSISAILMALATVSVSGFKFLLTRENRRRDRLTLEEYALESSGADLADKHPSFRFYT
ncbi:hypothetical protein KI688_003334 [Linnemannia hyalina]|uniref:Uncharacterized protein n=1 Tax=Linnemannia hyalina TaxID=64524 RepID=A0A9P8BQG0_9FUNG|nr:hypothetical protein KI688_003334 [Linnemannia hyalina]